MSLLVTHTNALGRAAATIAAVLDKYDFPPNERSAVRHAQAALLSALAQYRARLAEASAPWFE